MDGEKGLFVKCAGGENSGFGQLVDNEFDEANPLGVRHTAHLILSARRSLGAPVAADEVGIDEMGAGFRF